MKQSQFNIYVPAASGCVQVSLGFEPRDDDAITRSPMR